LKTNSYLFPLDILLGWLLAGRWENEIGINLNQRFIQKLAAMVVVKKPTSVC
jgi:hypothetical protein